MHKKYYITFIILLLLVISIPATLFLIGRKTNVKQFASTTKSATITASPESQSVNVGNSFTVDITVDGGGQAFNAAQATVEVSSNLEILSLNNVASTSGGCNFSYAPNESPSTSNLSFAGAILGNSSTSCTVYSVILQANSVGTGTVDITDGSVKAYADSSEIFSSVTNGNYTITNSALVGSISVNPVNESVNVNDTFDISMVVDGDGTAFNAAQATIAVSPNLSVLSLSSPPLNSGGCNFSYIPSQTPTATNLSFSGAILDSSSTNCTIYTATIKAISAGTGTITISGGSIKKFSDSSEMYGSATNGQYSISGVTITSTPLPTATVTAAPIPTVTSTPTAIPTLTSIPTLVVINPVTNNETSSNSQNTSNNSSSNNQQNSTNNPINNGAPTNIRPTLSPTGPSNLVLFGGLGSSALIICGALLIFL